MDLLVQVVPTNMQLHSSVVVDPMAKILVGRWITGSGLVRGISTKELQNLIVASNMQQVSFMIIDLREENSTLFLDLPLLSFHY